jgi:hypothetical protein
MQDHNSFTVQRDTVFDPKGFLNGKALCSLDGILSDREVTPPG